MSTIFISHSSSDDRIATEFHRWLIDNGFKDTFIDHHNILGGERWKEALRRASSTARVTICLVTPSWLESSVCFGEFEVSWLMGKRTVPIYLLNSDHELSDTALQRLSRVNAEDQGVDGTCFIDGQNGRLNFSLDEERANLILSGLRAAGASTDVGLDPCAFAVESNQRPSPFPGLRSYGDDDADAAIFFGRSREIAEILEMLRRMRASKETHPLVLFGASGAGKSSLLRAGVIPRLRREVPAWITLRAFRPGSDPLFNFAEAISTTLLDYGQSHASGVIKSNLLEAWRKDNAQRDEATQSGVLEAWTCHAFVPTLSLS
ncbi:MAG: toll/interleukin-1 receptor domain-containing protein [Henriciella sp.]